MLRCFLLKKYLLLKINVKKYIIFIDFEMKSIRGIVLMKKKSFMMLVVFTIFMISNVVFASDSEVRKKIVSVVYDDSGSMIWENKYSYSDYALQIFTASLGKEDKLNVVRMSNYYNNNEIDLSNQSIRQKHIDEIRGYQHNAGTPFGTIDTARDWLIKETTHYKDEADYWFVVITDGEFADMPFDIEGYFRNSMIIDDEYFLECLNCL
jgi:hypothetical protein